MNQHFKNWHNGKKTGLWITIISGELNQINIILSDLPPYSGYFNPSCQRQEIFLTSQEECVLFHKLSHVAHQRIIGRLRLGQD